MALQPLQSGGMGLRAVDCQCAGLLDASKLNKWDWSARSRLGPPLSSGIQAPSHFRLELVREQALVVIISCCMLDTELSAGAVHEQVQLMRSNHMTSHTLLEEVESELSKVHHVPARAAENRVKDPKNP